MSIAMGITTSEGAFGLCDSLRIDNRYRITISPTPKIFPIKCKTTQENLLVKESEIFSASVGDSRQGQDDRANLIVPAEHLPFPIQQDSNHPFLKLSRYEQKSALLDFLVVHYLPIVRQRLKEWSNDYTACRRLVWIAGHCFYFTRNLYVHVIPDSKVVAIGCAEEAAILHYQYSQKTSIEERLLEAYMLTKEDNASIGGPIHIVSKKMYQPTTHNVYTTDGKLMPVEQAKQYLI